MTTIIQNPPGLTGEVLAALWGTLAAGELRYGIFNDIIAGIDLWMIETPVEKPPKDSTSRLLEKMHLNSYYGSPYPYPFSNKEICSIEIGTQTWAVRFSAWHEGRYAADNKSCWTGKMWVLCKDIQMEGDNDAFQHDLTLLRLFESQWMPDAPVRDDIFSALSKFGGGVGFPLFTASQGTGKSTVALQHMQQIGRGTRPIVHVDTESIYDTTMIMGLIEDKRPEKMQIKVLKSRG